MSELTIEEAVRIVRLYQRQLNADEPSVLASCMTAWGYEVNNDDGELVAFVTDNREILAPDQYERACEVIPRLGLDVPEDDVLLFLRPYGVEPVSLNYHRDREHISPEALKDDELVLSNCPEHGLYAETEKRQADGHGCPACDGKLFHSVNTSEGDAALISVYLDDLLFGNC